jgi:hypothetical protein
MSGLGQVEMSGSRYVTGHVGPGPDHEQTRVRARDSTAQSPREEAHPSKAAELLKLSLRQVERLCRSYREQGPARAGF